MKTRTLYVSDLDGTLLGNDSRVSAASAEIISSLSRDGALITVATARTPATVVPLLSSTVTTPPAVVMTGCAFWSRTDGRFIAPHFMTEADMTSVLDLCRAEGVHPFVYVMAPDAVTLDVYHAAPRLNRAEESFYLERCRLALKRFHLATPAPQRALNHTMLFYAMADEARIRRAAEALGRETGCSVGCYPDIFNSGVWNLEIFPAGITKASAIARLREESGAERLVVFGDNLNDLPMLQAADVAVAVGNALPEVKEAADVVIEPNFTDSVARFIREDFYS